uniref:Mitochondrial import receptor subunit TOM40 homolog n=1 Tax=Glossina pallidipes TaxID=7398 RepID=A0A1A9Z4Y0_GLOPL
MKCDWCPPKVDAEFPPCFQIYPGVNKGANPGNIQHLHYLASRLKPEFFDGLVLDYKHRLAPNKIITSNWILSHNQPAGFRFGGIYVSRIHENILQTPTIHANINPTTMSTNVGIVYFPFRCLRIEADLQRAADDAPLQTQSTIEYRGGLSTLTLDLYNVSAETGRATVSFLRSVSEHLALGGEWLLEWTEPTSIMTDTAFAARYKLHDFSLASTISRQGIDVSFWSQVHPKIQMATMWAWQRKTSKSVGTICYKWDFEDAYVKGMFDSNLSVGFMYARTVSHLPVSVAMNLLINLHTNRFIFGLKFSLDPSGLQRDKIH